jgi:mRNA interferase MazF
MRRGDIVTAAPPGEFGKPRPVLVVQAFTGDYTERITVALITSDLVRLPGVRIPIEPTQSNGLAKPSEVAVDNLQTFSIKKIGGVIGSLDPRTMAAVDSALRLHLALF